MHKAAIHSAKRGRTEQRLRWMHQCWSSCEVQLRAVRERQANRPIRPRGGQRLTSADKRRVLDAIVRLQDEMDR